MPIHVKITGIAIVLILGLVEGVEALKIWEWKRRKAYFMCFSGVN